MAHVWCRRGADGSLVLTVHVQPGAKRTEIAGLYGDALKLRLAAPPVDGKANGALIAFMAQCLDVPRSAVELVTGAGSRHKILRVTGVGEAALAALAARMETS